MSSPRVSVIIPAYNQAGYLGEAIQSVLDQTFPDFEVIVVNDASPDDTPEVVRQFDDPRLKYIVHEENRGLPAARNTGMRASSGELIALLDSDDIFHLEKIQVHVDFLRKHPDVGVTYNSRFELNYSAKTIRELVRPPLVVGLSDFVLGFPFAPSDMVLRREWAFQVDLFDETYLCGGEDLDFPCRLALAGCQFASVDQGLNYRRHHSGRFRKNLDCRLDDVHRALTATFTDPRCPKEVVALRDMAYMNHYLVLVYHAFAQDKTDQGQEFVREAVQLNPSILDGKPCELVKFLVRCSIADESVNHEGMLRRMFTQLPPETAWLSDQYDWAVARGYLLKGTRAVMWGRLENGQVHFMLAADSEAEIDESFLRKLTHQLLDYQAEFGVAAAQNVLQNLLPYLEKIGGRASVRWLKGCYSANQALQCYRAGKYSRVPGKVMHAVANDPKYIINRGMLAILARSIVNAPLHSEG